MEQGQYAAYPRKPIREIDFGVISEGFSIVTKNWLPFAIASIVLVLIAGLIEMGMIFLVLTVLGPAPSDPSDLGAVMSYTGREYAITIPGSLIMWAAMSPVLLSYSMMTLKHIRGQEIQVGDVALGFSRFGQAAIVVIINQVAAMVGTLACIVGSLWVAGRLMLAIPVLADKEIAPMEAVRESWVLTGPHMWMAMLLYFVVSLVSGLGIIACCVGILITIPLLYVCSTLVYRDLSGMTAIPATPQPNIGVPPTDENQEQS